jgi:TrmH family RNA methyltransferase
MVNFAVVKIRKVLTKSDIKRINSLKRKSKRNEYGLFVAEGVKIVQELMNSNFKIQQIFALQSELDQFKNAISVSEKDLGRITHLSSPNKVLALVEIPKMDKLESSNETILVIDGVNDPGNLGTIIRTADWFGIKQIICSENSVDCFNSKVIMSTMGSIFRVNISYQHLPSYLAKADLPIYGALLEGKSIYQTEFSSPSIILMGSESHGISEELIPLINHPVTIPGAGNTESLNLGISTAIFCSEYYRQKSK